MFYLELAYNKVAALLIGELDGLIGRAGLKRSARIGVGEYEGVVRVSRRVFQILLPESPRQNGASKVITFTGRGSNSSLSGKVAAGS